MLNKKIIPVVTGKIKSKKDVLKILKFLEISVINKSLKQESSSCFKDIMSQIWCDGFDINYFYFDPTSGKILTNVEGIELNLGVLDWSDNFDYVEKKLKSIYKKRNINVYIKKINIKKIK